VTEGTARRGEVLCVPGAPALASDAAQLAGLVTTDVADLDALADALGARGDSVAAVLLDATALGVADAMALAKGLRRRDPPHAAVLVAVDRRQLDELALRDELFDDFVVTPSSPQELCVRLRHLAAVRGAPGGAELIEHGALTINLETYQAAIAGRPLGLTFMEYELLRFFATNAGRVLTRETLLSRVWGYEYYGGARTVDVHVRRLRAKLGEEHAHLIHTVRSVGYRFG
jgi:DNA-binding response OmpR family regulator